MECKLFFKTFLRIFCRPQSAKTLKFRGFRAKTPNTVFRVSCSTTVCAFPPVPTTIYSCRFCVILHVDRPFSSQVKRGRLKAVSFVVFAYSVRAF